MLRLNDKNTLANHYAYGSLFENLIINEIIKTQTHLGKRPSVYYWRESNGTEIDCIIENGNNKITALEIKAGETFNNSYVKNLNKFPNNNAGITVNKMILYAGDTSVNLSNIRVVSWKEFPMVLDELNHLT